MYTYTNGDIYYGMWFTGAKHGQGKYLSASTGSRFTGEWKSGQLVSSTVHTSDGSKFFSGFEGGVPSGEGNPNPSPNPNPNPNPNRVRLPAAAAAAAVCDRGAMGAVARVQRYISPHLPIYLPYISPISPLHLPYISPTSPLHLP